VIVVFGLLVYAGARSHKPTPSLELLEKCLAEMATGR